jgi:hypothetical protein
MAERTFETPNIRGLLNARPDSTITLEARIKGTRATLVAIEETREVGTFTFCLPIVGGSIGGVRQIAEDLLTENEGVGYKEVDTAPQKIS